METVPSVFTRIITGEFPGRFVYRDDNVVAMLTIEPLRPGHTLVVPVNEVDHWLDLDPDTLHELMDVARLVGRAIEDEFQPKRVGMMIAGLEVPHVHIHVSALDTLADLDFARVDRSPDPAELDAICAKLTERIRVLQS
jgi:histidine triad (HIT) family protein